MSTIPPSEPVKDLLKYSETTNEVEIKAATFWRQVKAFFGVGGYDQNKAVNVFLNTQITQDTPTIKEINNVIKSFNENKINKLFGKHVSLIQEKQIATRERPVEVQYPGQIQGRPIARAPAEPPGQIIQEKMNVIYEKVNQLPASPTFRDLEQLIHEAKEAVPEGSYTDSFRTCIEGLGTLRDIEEYLQDKNDLIARLGKGEGFDAFDRYAHDLRPKVDELRSKMSWTPSDEKAKAAHTTILARAEAFVTASKEGQRVIQQDVERACGSVVEKFQEGSLTDISQLSEARAVVDHAIDWDLPIRLESSRMAEFRDLLILEANPELNRDQIRQNDFDPALAQQYLSCLETLATLLSPQYEEASKKAAAARDSLLAAIQEGQKVQHKNSEGALATCREKAFAALKENPKADLTPLIQEAEAVAASAQKWEVAIPDSFRAFVEELRTIRGIEEDPGKFVLLVEECRGELNSLSTRMPENEAFIQRVGAAGASLEAELEATKQRTRLYEEIRTVLVDTSTLDSLVHFPVNSALSKRVDALPEDPQVGAFKQREKLAHSYSSLFPVASQTEKDVSAELTVTDERDLLTKEKLDSFTLANFRYSSEFAKLFINKGYTVASAFASMVLDASEELKTSQPEERGSCLSKMAVGLAKVCQCFGFMIASLEASGNLEGELQKRGSDLSDTLKLINTALQQRELFEPGNERYAAGVLTAALTKVIEDGQDFVREVAQDFGEGGNYYRVYNTVNFVSECFPEMSYDEFFSIDSTHLPKGGDDQAPVAASLVSILVNVNRARSSQQNLSPAIQADELAEVQSFLNKLKEIFTQALSVKAKNVIEAEPEVRA